MEPNEILKVFGELTIDGLWIGLAVFLTVQAAKIIGLVTESSKFKPLDLALASGLFYGIGWLAIEFAGVVDWSIEIVISLIFRWLVGSLAPGVFYQVLMKPFAQWIKIPDRFITAQE